MTEENLKQCMACFERWYEGEYERVDSTAFEKVNGFDNIYRYNFVQMSFEAFKACWEILKEEK